MRSFCCAICGGEQNPKLAVNDKTALTCKKCGKPLFAKRDKEGVTVKAFEDKPP